MTALRIERDVRLAPHTTLELGGPAEYFARIRERDHLLEALQWAQRQRLDVTVLGGGSNVVVSDRGIAGLVLVMATHGVHIERVAGDDAALHPRYQVCAQAGESWDALVARCVQAELAGIECMSGIPGSVGAAPIQNIGAYGQEVSECVRHVEVLDRDSSEIRLIDAAACDFGYRDSRFKRSPGRQVVLSVRLELLHRGQPQVRYAELARALAVHAAGAAPDLQRVRQTVLQLRRAKSMVLEAGSTDPNRRSAGSFFLNPVVSAGEAQRVVAAALTRGLIDEPSALPQYPQPDGSVKLSAAWLIERSGTHKGERYAGVGISSNHCLALVHHGGATTQALLELAARVRERVRASFEIELMPEPVMLGFLPADQPIVP